MRTYELMFIVDPRVADEEVASLTEEVKGLLTANGGQVIREEQWGRRKLAYEIDKLKEGKYVLLYLGGEDGQLQIAEAELRMRQNDRILRYLTVRTDEDLKRAGLPLPTEAPPVEEGAEGAEAAEAADGETERPAAAETERPAAAPATAESAPAEPAPADGEEA
ncbi:MAG TPA: 30S ribosomal protein S6 [Thermoanaerobaculia bacterium]|nr:30S ribosomal protein S6 [Thermoanaerobaculia bacterium]